MTAPLSVATRAQIDQWIAAINEADRWSTSCSWLGEDPRVRALVDRVRLVPVTIEATAHGQMLRMTEPSADFGGRLWVRPARHPEIGMTLPFDTRPAEIAHMLMARREPCDLCNEPGELEAVIPFTAGMSAILIGLCSTCLGDLADDFHAAGVKFCVPRGWPDPFGG